MSRPVQEIEREALVTYTSANWKRSRIATFAGAPDIPDPGHGRDELCPVSFFGQPFDASKPEDLAALSEFAVNELRGEPLWVLTVLDGPWIGQALNLRSDDGLTWVLSGPDGDVAATLPEEFEDGGTISVTHPDGTFSATVSAGWIHGAGFMILNLMDVGAGGFQGRGHFDTGRHGTKERRIELSLIFACPPQSCPQLPELYAGAAHAILAGVDFIRDASAAPGTLERDMADAGILAIRQLSTDPVQGRANHIGDARGWRWYKAPYIFRRQFTQQRVGRQPINPT